MCVFSVVSFTVEVVFLSTLSCTEHPSGSAEPCAFLRYPLGAHKRTSDPSRYERL